MLKAVFSIDYIGLNVNFFYVLGACHREMTQFPSPGLPPSYDLNKAFDTTYKPSPPSFNFNYIYQTRIHT